MERHKDPIASVTTVLNRLSDYTEARCSLDSNGRRVWEWIADHGNSADLLWVEQYFPTADASGKETIAN